MLRRTGQLGWGLVELHRVADDVERPLVALDRAQVPVGLHLHVVVQLDRQLVRRPHTLGIEELVLPLVERPLGERGVEGPDALGLVLAACCVIFEPRVVDELGTTDLAAQVGPVAVGLQHAQHEEATILGLVTAHQRIRVHLAVAARRPASTRQKSASSLASTSGKGVDKAK